MNVEVLIFGPAADAVGADRVRITAAGEGALEARAVLAALGEQHPGLRRVLQGARLAVNGAFAAPAGAVGPGDEVALIAMVGGG